MMLHGYDPGQDPRGDFVTRARAERARAFTALARGAWRRAGGLADRIGGPLGTALVQLWDAMAEAQRRRVALRQLQAMDDTLLKDIGLSRGHIEAAVAGRLAFDEADRALHPASPAAAPNGEVVRFSAARAQRGTSRRGAVGGPTSARLANAADRSRATAHG